MILVVPVIMVVVVVVPVIMVVVVVVMIRRVDVPTPVSVSMFVPMVQIGRPCHVVACF